MVGAHIGAAIINSCVDDLKIGGRSFSRSGGHLAYERLEPLLVETATFAAICATAFEKATSTCRFALRT